MLRASGCLVAASQLAHNMNLSIFRENPRFRANRIICTIGPDTQSVDAIKALITSGMNVARLNLSHGPHDFHRCTIDNVHRAAKETGANVGIALDTKGPEIRTGLFLGGEACLKRGDRCLLTTNYEFHDKGSASKFYVAYPPLPEALAPGDFIFIDDGLVPLRVLGREADDTIACEVETTRTIADRRGVTLPGVDMHLPAVSAKDRADLLFGAEQQVDFVFASFIRAAEQVDEVREALGESGRHIRIISKIENRQGLRNIDSIIARSDGIMVARGDLGVGIPTEKVTVAQKVIISKCNVAGKPVICATQMLESMTVNPRPTRAEVSDVTNAVLDGADSVMLSGETAKGRYPSETVQWMARICLEAQGAENCRVIFESIREMQHIPLSVEEAVCSSAVSTAEETNAAAIIALSSSGDSARLIAKYRPNCPIIVVTTRERTGRELTISRGMEAVFYDVDKHGADAGMGNARIAMGVEYAKTQGYIKCGDRIVVVQTDYSIVGFSNQSRVLIVR